MEELIPYTTIFSPSLSIGCKNLRPNSSLRLSLKLWSTCMNKTLFIETSKLRTYSWIETKNWNSSTSALVWNLFRPVPSILFVELRLTWPPKSYLRETTCLSTLIYGVLECFYICRPAGKLSFQGKELELAILKDQKRAIHLYSWGYLLEIQIRDIKVNQSQPSWKNVYLIDERIFLGMVPQWQ